MDKNELLRLKIRKAISLAGVSNYRVAKDAGISYNNFQCFLRGERNSLRVDTISMIAKVLNQPLAYFFEESNPDVDSIASNSFEVSNIQESYAVPLYSPDTAYSEILDRSAFTIKGYIFVGKHLSVNSFAYEADDDSMSPAIYEKDIIILRRNLKTIDFSISSFEELIVPDKIYAVKSPKSDRVIFRRLSICSDGLWYLADNKQFKPEKVVTASLTSFPIVAEVTALLRSF